MSEKKVQWHPGFVAALDLELRDYREFLLFEKEYNLNTKPLEIDLLVIKKNTEIQIDNEIGRIFRGHNLLEYKSPDDSMNIDTFYKAEAYASLYKAYGKTVDEIRADDVTVSLVRERRPEGLFRYFREHGGYMLSNPYQGIYYVEGNVLFPTQIIVTGELKTEDHIWLKALSGRMKPQDMRRLFEYVLRLNGKYDRELADSVVDVSVRANESSREILMKGEEKMSGALLEIMMPQVKKEAQEMAVGMAQDMAKDMAQNMAKDMAQELAKDMAQDMAKDLAKQMADDMAQQARRQGIRDTVSALRSLRHDDDEIKRVIMDQYDLTDQDAEEYLD